MAQGRCAGCGHQDTSIKVMKRHIVQCSDFLALFQRDPSKALGPGPEFDRWSREENDADSKAARKDARLVTRFAELDVRRDAQNTRWEKPPDILD